MDKHMAPTLGQGTISVQGLILTAYKSPVSYGLGILAINILIFSVPGSIQGMTKLFWYVLVAA